MRKLVKKRNRIHAIKMCCSNTGIFCRKGRHAWAGSSKINGIKMMIMLMKRTSNGWAGVEHIIRLRSSILFFWLKIRFDTRWMTQVKCMLFLIYGIKRIFACTISELWIQAHCKHFEAEGALETIANFQSNVYFYAETTHYICFAPTNRHAFFVKLTAKRYLNTTV